MKPLDQLRVLVVYKRSRLSFYEQSQDPDVQAFLKEEHEGLLRSHEQNEKAIQHVLATLDDLGVQYDAVWRAKMHNALGRDLVIAIGGDGTVLEASHYAAGVPILGVNSDPQRSVGFYNWTTAEGFRDVMERLGTQPITVLQRLELMLDGRLLPQLALNDVVIKDTRPVMWQYLLGVDDEEERRCCRDDGLLISAPGGTTAYAFNANCDPLPLNDCHLLYTRLVVRGEQSHIGERLWVKSLTREARLYVDGYHISYPFGLGHELAVRVGSPITLIGDLRARREEFLRKHKRVSFIFSEWT